MRTCVWLSAVGAPWLEATLPPALGELVTTRIVVPQARTVATVAGELASVATPGALAAGVSMNGTLALAAAGRHPDAFAGVIAVTSPPQLPPDRSVNDRYGSTAAEPERVAEFERRRAIAEACEEGSPEQLAAWRRVDEVRRWHDFSADHSDTDALVSMAEGWVPDVMADGASVDWPALIARVSVPVLLVLGRADFVVPPISWDVDALPSNFTVHVFERSGHTPFYEEPDRFVGVVEEWLSTAF